MPRIANPKCLICSQEDIAIAKEKSCWEGKKCHDRRSWHRTKAIKNEQRRIKRSQEKKLAVPAPEIPPYAILYVERWGKAVDAKVVGMYAQYFEGGQKVDETEAYRNRALPSVMWKQYAVNILKALQSEHPSLKGFIESVNIDVRDTN